jgi:hypothetical protein
MDRVFRPMGFLRTADGTDALISGDDTRGPLIEECRGRHRLYWWRLPRHSLARTLRGARCSETSARIRFVAIPSCDPALGAH